MNTSDVIKEVSRRMGCYQRDAKELLEHFAAVMIERTAKGEKIRLSFLATFYPGTGRLRRNGTRRRVLKFKPARKFVEQLNAEQG